MTQPSPDDLRAAAMRLRECVHWLEMVADTLGHTEAESVTREQAAGIKRVAAWLEGVKGE